METTGELERRLSEAHTSHAMGEYSHAIEAYRSILHADGANRSACVGMALSLHARTCAESAALSRICRESLLEGPDDPELWVAAALLALGGLQLGAAEVAVRRAAGLDPKHALAKEIRGHYDRYRSGLRACPDPSRHDTSAKRWARLAQRIAAWRRRTSPLAAFCLWQLASRLLHGRKRWIQIYAGIRACVRVGDYRAYRMWLLGGTQPEKVALWRALAQLRPSLCIDAGANYGEFTLSVADLDVPVLAVEANPEVAECLVESCAGHSCIQVVSCALSSSEGEIEFHFAPHETGGGGVGRIDRRSANDATRFLGRVRQVRLRARRLDALVRERAPGKLESLLLKIDVEGSEPEVIETMLPLLKECRWWRSIVEFNATALSRSGRNPRQFWSQLRSFRGVIIDSHTAGSSLRTLESTLPEFPPDFCDVLIGVGVIGAER